MDREDDLPILPRNGERRAREPGQRAQAGFMALVEALPDAIGLKDVEGRYLACNRRFERLVDATGEAQIEGKTDDDLLPAELARLFRRDAARALAEHGAVTSQEWLTFADGHREFSQVVHTPFFDDGGTLRGVLAVARDVTGFKLAEERLLASEKHFRELLQFQPSATAITAGAEVISTNQKFTETFGYAQADVPSVEAWFARAYPDPDYRRWVMDAWIAEMAAAQKEGRATQAREFRVACKDGSSKRVLMTGRQVGSLFLHSFEDVTEARRLEDRLRESAARLNVAQRLARIGNWELDLRTGALTGSDELFRVFEVDPNRPGGPREAFIAAVHPEDREAVEAFHARALDAGASRSFAYRLRMADGRIKRVQERCEIEYGPEGQPVRSIGIVEDVTERERAQEEKARLEDQLRQAQKMESVGRLAGGVAHDFNNMLGVILSNVELVSAKLGAAHPLQDELADIRNAAERSADLTQQLLAFARKQTIRPRVLLLNDAVAGMLKILRRLIGEQVALRWRPAPDLWHVLADPSQIDQILANLCVNARDAIADVGKITIETRNAVVDAGHRAEHADASPGEYVLLAVSDDGCGMDRQTMARVFEPFFTTKTVGRGTGMGLAIVYGAVRQSGGFMHVESEPGRGSTFQIYLPRHVGPAHKGLGEGPVEEQLRGAETVLLVEDDPALLKVTAKILGGFGYTVLAAGSPRQAARLAAEHTGAIHLLLTDVIMPEKNGRALADQLQASLPELKVLFMSGYTADVIAHHGVLDEGVHLVQKPFTAQALARKVREVLGGGAASSSG